MLLAANKRLTNDIRKCVIDAQRLYGLGKIGMARSIDGRRTLLYETKSLKLTDEFDGGNPFCGIVRVAQKSDNSAVWSAYYHGWLNSDIKDLSVEEVFNFLRQALCAEKNQSVYRGPQTFIEYAGMYSYKNNLEYGNIDCFYGGEAIYLGKQQVYYARYGGGSVNQMLDTGEV